MAEIEASLLAKIHSGEGLHDRPVLIGFLRSRKKYIGTLIEATSGQSLKELKREVKKKGGKTLKVYKEINTIYAELPVDRVTEMSSVACAQKVYDAEGAIKPCLNESVPLVMGVEKWQLPYRVKRRKFEGNGVKVAVIDSGIDHTHPDLAWRVKRRKNFSGGRRNRGAEHGTHVAGIIAGSGKLSGYRYVGVAPKAKLYDAKVFINSATPTTRPIIIEAVLWAVKQRVNVINMSFGDSQGCSDGTCILCKTANYAVSRGITVVAAAGNAGPGEGTITCPGNAQHVITVGASTKSSPVVVTGFSSRGSLRHPDKPDVVAPGEKIMAPQPDRSYTVMSGTSMAAPHVSGMAALLHQSLPSVNAKQHVSPPDIKRILKSGSIDLGEHSTAQGSGLVNFDNNLSSLIQARRRSWFSKRKPKTLEPVVQATQLEETNSSPTSCQAAMNMFCPHYDQNICNDRYESCIHFQSIRQTQVLRNVKLPQADALENSAVNPLIPDQVVQPQYIISRKLAGKVIGTLQGQPIAGATISVGTRSTTTNTEGDFTLRKAGKGVLPVVISGENICPRTMAVKNTTLTRAVKLDAIELNGKFNLRFYRELVRGGHPKEGILKPIHRWINPKPPRIYINLDTSATLDKKITRKTIKGICSMIHQILPVFSGGKYHKASIKFQRSEMINLDDIPDNGILITFNDTIYRDGALGITLTDPDFLSPTISFINKALILVVNHEDFFEGFPREMVVAHEIGHAFGYRHTSVLPSIMDRDIVFKPFRGLFSEHDILHMKIMYSRPVGNFDLDNDPVSAEKVSTQPVGRQVFIDKWVTSPLTPKIQKRLQSLAGLSDHLLQETTLVE